MFNGGGLRSSTFSALDLRSGVRDEALRGISFSRFFSSFDSLELGLVEPRLNKPPGRAPWSTLIDCTLSLVDSILTGDGRRSSCLGWGAPPREDLI